MANSLNDRATSRGKIQLKARRSCTLKSWFSLSCLVAGLAAMVHYLGDVVVQLLIKEALRQLWNIGFDVLLRLMAG
jgi:hypothetical protein